MKLILREDVENLGKGGELVEVKPGYGRNYLLPRGLAVLANPRNVKELEHQKAVAQAKAAKLKASAQAVAKRLSETPVTLKRKVGEQDKLYGSVTALDVAEALAARGLEIDRRPNARRQAWSRCGPAACDPKSPAGADRVQPHP